MSDIEMLVIQARGAYSTSRVVTGLAAAVEALQAQLAEANKTIDAIEAAFMEPSEPNSFYLTGFANQFDAVADLYGEELPNAVKLALAEYRKKAIS